MPQAALRITLTDEERQTLTSGSGSRSGAGEHRKVERARVILLASEGLPAREIAPGLKTRLARVSKWRQRFSQNRLAGLHDAARPGKPRIYDEAAEKRISTLLDEEPPEGYRQWNGRLLADRLGDTSDDQVWRVLRKHKIQLQRRRSWCISTDSEFGPKSRRCGGLVFEPAGECRDTLRGRDAAHSGSGESPGGGSIFQTTSPNRTSRPICPTGLGDARLLVCTSSVREPRK
jgi:transposase